MIAGGGERRRQGSSAAPPPSSAMTQLRRRRWTETALDAGIEERLNWPPPPTGRGLVGLEFPPSRTVAGTAAAASSYAGATPIQP